MKIKYLLLYGVPALIIGGFSLSSIPRGIMDFISYVGNPEPYLFLYGVMQFIMPWPFILLASIYMFSAFKQENINKYTNWSIMSWFVGVIVFIISEIFLSILNNNADAESVAFGTMYLAGYFLYAVVFSVICAHLIGLIKGEIKPKILNLIFVIFIIISIAIVILNYFIGK